MESLVHRKDKESLMEHRLAGFGCGIFFFSLTGVGETYYAFAGWDKLGNRPLSFSSLQKKKKAYKVTANLSCISAAK